MNDEKPFNLKEFQKEVYDDLQRSKKRQAKTDSIKRKDGKEYTNEFSYIKRNILKTLNKVTLFAEKRVLELNESNGTNEKINEILDDSKVKILLCNEFKKQNLHKLFEEKLDLELVKIFTNLFIDKPIAKELNIEKNVNLFSLLIQKTREKGFTVYCK